MVWCGVVVGRGKVYTLNLMTRLGGGGGKGGGGEK